MAYTQPGNGIEALRGGLDVASFTGLQTVNYSTVVSGADVTAPILTSAEISTNGQELTLFFNESVTSGAGGNGGVALTMTGGAVTATYSSATTNTRVYTLSRTVSAPSVESGTVAYTQPGNGIEDIAGNDLASFSGVTLLNRSTVNAPGNANPPTVSITGPTAASSYATTAATISLSGTSSDNSLVTSVTWQNNQGGSGVAVGTTSWSVASVSLALGVNVIVVTAFDDSGNSTPATLTVTRSNPGDIVQATVRNEKRSQMRSVLAGGN